MPNTLPDSNFGVTGSKIQHPGHVKNEVVIGAGVNPAMGQSSASLDRMFVRGVAWIGGVKWGVQLVTWASTIIVARILTPQDYGIVSMAAVLLMFITMLSESGIGMTVVTVRDITSDQTEQLHGAAISFGVISFALACAIAFPIGWFYEQPALPMVIIVTSVTLFINAFRVVPSALLQRDLRFARIAVIDGGQGLLQALATILLATLGFRYWSLVWGGLAGALFVAVATVASRPCAMQRPRWRTLRPVVPFTGHVMFSRVFWYAYTNSDFVVAGKRLGAQALGGYSYAWTLASIPVDKITALVGGVTPPMFAAVQHDQAALRRYFLMVVSALAVLAFPITIGMALIAHEFVSVVFGERWSFISPALQILAAYAAIRTIIPTANQILLVTGDHGFQMYQNGIALLALPVAFYIGSFWGTVGIALAWVLVHPLIIYVPSHVRIFRRLGLTVREYLLALWPAISGCLCMAGGIVTARSILPSQAPPVVILAAEVLAGALAYAACLATLHHRRISGFLTLWRSAA